MKTNFHTTERIIQCHKNMLAQVDLLWNNMKLTHFDKLDTLVATLLERVDTDTVARDYLEEYFSVK